MNWSRTLTCSSFPVDHGTDPFISKKAPGDRQFTQEEVRRTASLIEELINEGKVSTLPPTSLRKIMGLFKKRAVPDILAAADPEAAEAISTRVPLVLRRKEIAIKVVDLGNLRGFPREQARPSCEVMFVEKGGKILWLGRKELVPGGGVPTIYITSAFYAESRKKPGLLLQAILHPLLEWIFDLPHMVAVLCESTYNDTPPGKEAHSISDLNRFIAGEAAKDRDFAYFDRILGTSYEPDEFRMEELTERFGENREKIEGVVSTAHQLGVEYRKLVEELLRETKETIAEEGITSSASALDDGDADRALTILRKIESDPRISVNSRERCNTLIDLAVRCYALGADPSYEGLTLDKGNIIYGPHLGNKANIFMRILLDSIGLTERRWKERRAKDNGEGSIDPLGKRGKARIIHVLEDLDRPSAKFIDGHDRVHWVFKKSFVEALIASYEKGKAKKAVPAILAYRIVRDGAFPDEKLKVDRQYTVAVKGAVEGYRFFQSFSSSLREEIDTFYELNRIEDPLYQLFLSLGEESKIARASHMIKDALSKTHSLNYVRYPDTSLAGKVIVITGGGTGMGRALALEAAIRGGNVVIMGRRPSPLEETRADMNGLIEHLGLTNRTFQVQGDVGDPKYVGDMFEKIREEFGRIDILFNNAGVSGPVDFGSVYQESHFKHYRETVDIHLTGSWLASLEAAKIMESQPSGGLIVMVGTYYCESIHRHVLHAYPGRLPYTSAQSAKLALGDYLAWALAESGISVLSLNPSAVSTERIQRGSGVFDRGSKARAKIGREVPPETLEKGTLERTVTKDFVHPRDFAKVALDVHQFEFQRTVGGQRLPMGGVTYEQPPGVIPSPASLVKYPDLVGKWALVTVSSLSGNDRIILESSVNGLIRSGANIVIAGLEEDIGPLSSYSFGDSEMNGGPQVQNVNLGNLAEVQELFDNLERVDLLLHFTGSVDWKFPLTKLSYEEWTETVERYGYVPRVLTWMAEKRMDGDRIDGTIVYVGPDLSGVPSILERDLVQVFQAMLRPAVATESMERALMRKSFLSGTAPAHVSNINIALLLPGRTDGRNKQPNEEKAAATILWLLGEGKKISGAVLLPDEHNSIASLPREDKEIPGSMAGKVATVTGGVRNLGRAISLRFSSEGASVVAASRYPEVPSGMEGADEREAIAAGENLLSSVRSFGGKAAWVDTDISQPEQVRNLVEFVSKKFGSIDVFVNNAGAGGDFSLVTEVMRDHKESWDSVLSSNLIGPWYATNLLRNIMGKQKQGGAIVNVSTHYSDHPYIFRTIYTVSKILLKALTSTLKDSLAVEGIHITDVAPSLIAGPRMDWVMRNYAEKFANHLSTIEGFRESRRKTLMETFVESFNRARSSSKRGQAEEAFLTTVRKSRVPAATRQEIEEWYGRIKEWFHSTVPDSPPSNEDVAEAVLYGAKNGRFMEKRFIGVSPLPQFVSFPPSQKGAEGRLQGNTFLVTAVGTHGEEDALPEALHGAITRGKGQATVLIDSLLEPGRVSITRPSPSQGGGRRKMKTETIGRSIDLTNPRLVEPWLDNALMGLPPFKGAVLLFGLSRPGKDILDYSPDEMKQFCNHLSKLLSLFGESIRAVEEGGNVIVIVPTSSTGEGQLIRSAARQVVRTALAEQHFLYPSKRVNLTLLSTPDEYEKKYFNERVTDILSGLRPAQVESIPVGPERP